MAFFQFNISNESTFNVIQEPSIETECSTIFQYRVEADFGDSITMFFGQTLAFQENLVYIQSDVETEWDGSEITITYGSDLYVRFSLSNSGVPGYFNRVKLGIRNNTNGGQTFYEQDVRENDSPRCDSSNSSGGDLNYTHEFTSSTVIPINHNLGKNPSVTIVDSSGNLIEGDVSYDSLQSLTITILFSTSGTVYLN